eukprot:scaffold6550_cov167-Amphora_coffeaeformis.AAC.4
MDQPRNHRCRRRHPAGQDEGIAERCSVISKRSQRVSTIACTLKDFVVTSSSRGCCRCRCRCRCRVTRSICIRSLMENERSHSSKAINRRHEGRVAAS